MPQLANIVLNDGANFTLTPTSLVAGAAALAARGTGASTLDRTLTLQNKLAGNKLAYRFTEKLTFPVVRTESGVEVVVDNIIANIDIRLPVLSTAAERTKLRLALASSLANAIIVDCIDNNVGIF